MSKERKLPSTTAIIRETIPSEKQLSPSFFNYAAIVIALVSLAGLAGVVLTDNDDPQIQANQDNIEFLFSADMTMRNVIGEQINRSVNNTDRIIALQDYDNIITTQIGNIRSDIISKFPQAADVSDKEKSSKSDTPFLTLKMDKTDFVLGNMVIFTGTAQPNGAIFLTLKDPDRALWQIPISKTLIIDGSYSANYTLRLDDPVGTWQVYARQLSDQTKTLTFKVE